MEDFLIMFTQARGTAIFKVRMGRHFDWKTKIGNITDTVYSNLNDVICLVQMFIVEQVCGGIDNSDRYGDS